MWWNTKYASISSENCPSNIQYVELMITFGFPAGNDTLPETNSSPLKMDGCNDCFLLGFGLFYPIFRCFCC